MDVQQVIAQAREVITVKRVFGDPYEKDGVTVITAAKVQGGGGGGGGESPGGQGKGEGGGFGLSARPSGAYVIRDGDVTWQPAVDVNRLVAIAGAVTIAAFLSLRSIARARAKVKRAKAKRAKN
jgi:uncharacterized spore protein YtfJ